MIVKIRHWAVDVKYAAVSFVSVLPALLFHLVHWFSAPMLLSAGGMGAHHHAAAGNSAGGGWIAGLMPAILLLNVASIALALAQLRKAWKEKRHSGHVYACCAVSLAVLAISVYSLVDIALA
ncbi:MAG: hypothetical protein J7639_20935 [Paenibacillaceae bacterium]|nr:hypothetical protein [Paenibacillaceae bacterium]